MLPRVRLAIAADLPAITEMIREFMEYLNGIADPAPIDDAAIARMADLAFGPDPLCDILIADGNEGPVGYLVCCLGVDMDVVAPTLQVADLFVRDGRRGHGVGRALMTAARVLAAERGAHAVTWTVWRKNPRAIAFYAKLGAVAVDEEMPMTWPAARP